MEAKGFGIEVNFVTGRYVATSHNDRRQPEWPPHPARLFSALVATWADSDEPSRDERRVLEWLETLGPPAIAADLEAVPRKVVSHFVPVNDTAIVSRKWQERQAERLRETTRGLDDALAASGGKPTRGAERLRRDLVKLKDDVASQVSSPGKTNVRVAQQLLPEGRPKRERHFPSMTIGALAPGDCQVTVPGPRVTFTWDHDLTDEACGVLDALSARLTRLGHSSSLVSCRVVRAVPDANLLPSRTGTISLRHVQPGQLAELERRFASHKGISPRALPYVNIVYSEAECQPTTAEDRPNTAGDWLVFEFLHNSRAFPATRTVEVATALRSAMFSFADEPIPEGLSGHTPDGGPTSEPHVAFVPLPFAGWLHGDGRLLGAAVSVPDDVDQATRDSLYRAIGKWERHAGGPDLKLVFGRHGEIRLRRLRGHGLASLRHRTWRGPSRHWASVTPIALPRHPGRLRGGTTAVRARAWLAAEAAVRTAVVHVGLPEPVAVQVSLAPFVTGVQATHSFPPFRQPDKNGIPVRRQLVHAAITFDRKILGPLMLGAGRFLGLGLMHPTRTHDAGVTGQDGGDAR